MAQGIDLIVGEQVNTLGIECLIGCNQPQQKVQDAKNYQHIFGKPLAASNTFLFCGYFGTHYNCSLSNYPQKWTIMLWNSYVPRLKGHWTKSSQNFYCNSWNKE